MKKFAQNIIIEENLGGNNIMKTKYTFIILFSFLSSLSLFSQEEAPYFCTTEKRVLEYVRKYTDGNIKWYHEMIINKVSLNGGKGVIEYSSQLFNEKKRPLIENPAIMIATVDNGSVTVNIAESMASIFKSVLGEKRKISSQGDMSVLPSDMAPGDTLKSAFCSVSFLGMTMNISVTDRKVLCYETIITPAGTFDCIVIQESKVEKGMGRNRHTSAKTWYSRGMGMIRHDTYNKKGILETSEVLTSINNTLR